MRAATAALLGLLSLACASPAEDAREAELRNVLVSADEPHLRTRLDLVAGKYRRMDENLFWYHRSNVPVFLHDWRHDTGPISASSFDAAQPLVLGTGDPHPENYGCLLAGDGTLGLEPNDFDGADRVPYLWDLRRLAVGMVIAAYASNEEDEVAREAVVTERRALARAVASGYAAAIERYASGMPRARITDGLGNALLVDLFSRSRGDLVSRDELTELTDLVDGVRRLKLGQYNPDASYEELAPLPEQVVSALPEALARYRTTLLDPPPPEYFTLLDQARWFGKGIASWARVRVLLLIRGPSDDPADDVLLELKELADTGLAGWYPPGIYYDSPEQRTRATSRAMWARPDAEAKWGTTQLLGIPCQVNLESEGQKTLRVSRMVGRNGTAAVLTDLARLLGEIQARIHATPVPEDSAPAEAVWDVIRNDPEAFADEQADVALEYAEVVRGDWERFRRILEREGPTLGLPIDPRDRPRPEWEALLGHPLPETAP